MSEGIRDSGNEGSKPLVSSSAAARARVLDPNGMEGVVGDWVSEVSRGKRSPFRVNASYRMLVEARSHGVRIFQNC